MKYRVLIIHRSLGILELSWQITYPAAERPYMPSVAVQHDDQMAASAGIASSEREYRRPTIVNAKLVNVMKARDEWL